MFWDVSNDADKLKLLFNNPTSVDHDKLGYASVKSHAFLTIKICKNKYSLK